MGAADCAGVQPGDVLLGWVCASDNPNESMGSSGQFESGWDVEILLAGQALLGEVEVSCLRHGAPLSLVLGPRRWGLTVRPDLQGHAEEGAELFRGLAVTCARAGDGLLAAWWLRSEAEILSADGRWQAADASFAEALTAASGHLGVQALIHTAWGNSRFQRNDYPGAAQAHQEALERWRALGGEELAEAAVLCRCALVALEQGRFEDANFFAESAYEICVLEGPGTLAEAEALQTLGTVRLKLTGYTETQSLIIRALTIRERLAPGSLEHADSIATMGTLARFDNRHDEAQSLYERALRLADGIDPAQAVVIHRNLGLVAMKLGDLEAAEHHGRRALALDEKHRPGSMALTRNQQNLAITLSWRGNRDEAERLFREALVIRRRLAPGSLWVCGSLNNLGIMLLERGDIAGAEQAFRESLAIGERLPPEPIGRATVLGHLAVVAQYRGELGLAESYRRKSLALFEMYSLNSLAIALALNDLAHVVCHENPAEAKMLAAQALSRFKEAAPDHPVVPKLMITLGEASAANGDLEIAIRHFIRAAEILRARSPLAPRAASALANAARTALQLDRTEAAQRFVNEAVGICDQLPFSHAACSGVLWAAGAVSYNQEDLRRAQRFYARALANVEAVRGRVGSNGRRQGGYASPYVGLYQDYIGLLLELDRPGEALGVVERSRSHAHLEMLASRDLMFEAEIPAELETARRALEADFERTQQELVSLDANASGHAAEQLLDRLHEVRDRRLSIEDEIRRRSPRLAALRSPKSLDLEGVQSVLDPGTVLLAYVVAEESTYLFVVSSLGGDAGCVAITLDIGEAELSRKIRTLRSYILTPAEGKKVVVLERAQQLYDLLVRPAEPWLKSANRILICPDGPLQTLPFGALRRSRPGGEGDQFLIEWKPLHTVASATVYARLRERRRRREGVLGNRDIALFGDPHYPAMQTQENHGYVDSQVAFLLSSGKSFETLPGSRREVETISRVWGDRALTYLGRQATEEQVKSIGEHISIVHLACHGILDPRFPLNSALVLAIPEVPSEARENGLLQAWEVFETLRIDADLVVLSACDTALGDDVRGEGLVGLTHAFQYAGARCIVASLWSVPDEATSALMRLFHDGLLRGLSTDEALREAKLVLIREPIEVSADAEGQRFVDASHPYSWAGFQLIGDWQ